MLNSLFSESRFKNLAIPLYSHPFFCFLRVCAFALSPGFPPPTILFNTVMNPPRARPLFRRSFLQQLFGVVATAGAATTFAAERTDPYATPAKRTEGKPPEFPIKPSHHEAGDILVKPRWLFLKVHTDEGVIGLGEPITEGRAKTCAAAVSEIEPYLIGKDRAMWCITGRRFIGMRFYRGGPILTSALSGIEQALWDIKGKLLGVPVYELLGGPTRDRVRVYAHVGNRPDLVKQRKAKASPRLKQASNAVRNRELSLSPKFIDEGDGSVCGLREAGGNDVEIAIDFHGAISRKMRRC